MSTPIEDCLTIAQKTENRFAGNLSTRFGLMPQSETTTSLPSELRFVDTIVRDLPRLYRRGQVCRAIMDLPQARETTLARLTDGERIRLNMCYGLLSYSFRYAWEDAHEGERLKHLPPVDPAYTETHLRDFHSFDLGNTCVRYITRNLIQPWKHLWESMGLKRPYFEAALFTQNFRLTDGHYSHPEIVSQDNSDLLLKFFGTETEKHFFLGVQEVTGKFNCVSILIALQHAMLNQDHALVTCCCDRLTALWRTITEDVFMRFDTRIDPIEWGSSVGKWTASPFYKQEGFSGMFFPAFHILDILIGRVKYESFLGDLIVKTREILPPNWQRFFQAIGELNLKDYVARHSAKHPELGSALVRIQDVYQLFFHVHRRKIFSFEYQAILTGRNSTNAGIAVDVKTHQEETVYDLATWNKIDDILLESGAERPLEQLDQQSKCPFSGTSLATSAPKSYPATVGARCPFSGQAVKESPEPPTQEAELIRAKWTPLAKDHAGFYGAQLSGLPFAVQPGDRCLIVETNQDRHEAEFVGRVDQKEWLVRTPLPIKEIKGIKLLPGIFQRQSGDGPNAKNTSDLPTLVICQGERSMIATTLAAHSSSPVLILLIGSDEDAQCLRKHGCMNSPLLRATSFAELATDSIPGEFWADDLIYTVSGDPEFVRQALDWMGENLKPVQQTKEEWFSDLRIRKTLRLISFKSSSPVSQQTMGPWDLLEARSNPRYVALRGKILDITLFQHIHLGGDNILQLLSGVDITDEFSRAHPQNQVSMPDALAVANYDVSSELTTMTEHAYRIVRAANVLELQLKKLAPYEDAPSVYRQRASAMIEAIDLSVLWRLDSFEQAIDQKQLKAIVDGFLTPLAPIVAQKVDMPVNSSHCKNLLLRLKACIDRVIKNLASCLHQRSHSATSPKILRTHLEQHLEILRDFSSSLIPCEQPDSTFPTESPRVSLSRNPTTQSLASHLE